MNIALIGMMGSGKTTISKLLSIKLNCPVLDTDEIITQEEKCDINTIFKIKGESYFRQKETTVLKKVLNGDNQIISTGGGIIKSEYNRKLLNDKSIVIYLKADSDSLYDRVKNNTERPLLNDCDMKNKISVLLKERELLYEKAHIIIDTNSKTQDSVVSEIVEKLKNYDKSRC